MADSVSNPNIAIRCQGLSKTYGDVQALRPLSLEVRRGSIFGFLGRNGAGKTTTIRLLTGLAHPTSGSAWINQVETSNSDSRSREQFGYLPQDPAFYNWMTPIEYLDYIARLFRVEATARRARIAGLLDQFGLVQAANRPIGGFSGGMVQRLGIAQSLIHQPKVLLLDEPTSALDPAGRHEVLELIDGLRGEVTVFLSSHILGDVERVCDTIGIIHEGELRLVADRDELLSRYATNVVALEFEQPQSDGVSAFISSLENLPWVSAVTRENDTFRVAVTDVSRAKSELLTSLVEARLSLNRYQWMRPTLEEVFLMLSD